LQKLSNYFVYVLIPLFFFSGMVLTSFSDEPKEIQMKVEPPQMEFEDVSREKMKDNKNNPSGGNPLTEFITGSGYSLNGIPLFINTPEGITLNEKLIEQRELEKLEAIHGEKFWERVELLTWDHYGLADAMINPYTENSYHQNGIKYDFNSNSNFEYFALERGYDPRNLKSLPNDVFSPQKASLARAVMEDILNQNSNDFDLDSMNELDLRLIAPNALFLNEEQKSQRYHNDISQRASSTLNNFLPSLSSSSSGNDNSSQNTENGENESDRPITQMPNGGKSTPYTNTLTPNSKQPNEIFQNTDHIKKIISNENFEPNYKTQETINFPLTEILISFIMTAVSAFTAIVIIHLLRKRKQKLVFAVKSEESKIDYVLETKKLLIIAREKYESNHIKDAYEKFSQAIRLYYSFKFNLDKEITAIELLNQITDIDKTEYRLVRNSLALCGMIEFAKHNEKENEFKKCISNFTKNIELQSKDIEIQ